MSARPWYGFAGLLLSAIMFASPQARADDTTTLPPVVITGTATTTEGQTIYCFTPACEEIIEFNTQQFDGTFETISQGNGGAVDKDTFCANLAGEQASRLRRVRAALDARLRRGVGRQWLR